MIDTENASVGLGQGKESQDLAAAHALSEENLSTIFENAPDSILICNTDGYIRRANGEVERVFGYAQEELIQRKIEILVPDSLREAHEEHRETYLKNPSFRAMRALGQLSGRKKDGTVIPVDISVMPLASPEGLLLFCIIRDQSETRLAQKLASQLRFERVLAELSTRFVNLKPEDVDGEIKNALQASAEALNADRAHLAQVQAGTGDFLVTHAWAGAAAPEFPKQYVRDLLPWLAQRTLNGERTLARPGSLPAEASREREYMEMVGAKTAVIVPFRVGAQVLGGISCDALHADQPWDESTLSRLQVLADVFANALSRKRTDEQLQAAYIEIRNLRERLENENRYLREEIKLESSHSGVIGDSPAIRSVLKRAEQVAHTDATVLILGETGTGKELIARTIHDLSRRSKRAMVKANCAALPASLIESELFGREKGAYTGALAKEIGRFELADQSTIFLDEIGELPLELQPKLLRVLQDGEFERLGSARTLRVDVRIIAATNRDLAAMVKEGKFREDLFYRLNVVPICVPPLRERQEDIPALVWHFLKLLSDRMGRSVETIHDSTMKCFQRHCWPGNVRELRNMVERNLILNSGPVFRVDTQEFDHKPNPTMRRFDEVEAEYFRTILESTRWRVRGESGAAAILGLKPTTLESRLKKLNVQRPH